MEIADDLPAAPLAQAGDPQTRESRTRESNPRDELQRAKLRVEVRKWLLARLTADQAALAKAEEATASSGRRAAEDSMDFSDLSEADCDALRRILEGRLGRSAKGPAGAG